MFNLVAGNSYYYDFRNESQNGVNTNNMKFLCQIMIKNARIRAWQKME